MFKNILINKSPILEEYTLGEFTFGFELEAFFNNASSYEFEQWVKSYWHQKVDLLFKQDPSTKRTKSIDLSSMGIESDGSLRINDYVSRECQECIGEGNTECFHCNGTGQVECSECKGEGEILLNDEEKVECEECNGEGKVDCEECFGEGQIECQECFGSGRIEMDEDEAAYEFNSPIMKFTPNNLTNIINFLSEGMKNNFINTNETCGFHIHIGFPNKALRSEDIFWVLSHLVLEDNGRIFKEIQFHEGIELFTTDRNEYASLDFLSDMQYAYDKLFSQVKEISKEINKKEKDGNSYEEDFYLEAKKVKKDIKQEVELWKEGFKELIAKYYDDEKYSVFRQHPQGTLEWRGPRGFLDNKMISIMRSFFLKKLYPFVKWINNTLNKDYLYLGADSQIKLSRHAFNKILENYKSPAPKEREYARFNVSKSDIEALKSFVASNKETLKLNLLKLIVLKKQDGIYIVSGGLRRRGDADTLSLNNVQYLKYTSIENLIINLNEDIYLFNNYFSNCNIKKIKSSNDSFRASEIIGGSFYEGRFEDSIIKGGAILSSTLNMCKIINGAFQQSTIRHDNIVAGSVTFEKCVFYNSFPKLLKTTIFDDCEISVRFQNEDFVFSNKILIKNQLRMILPYNKIIIKEGDFRKQLKKTILESKKNRYDEFPLIKLGENIYDYIAKYYNF